MSMAIAYAMKKRKKMAEGGKVEKQHGTPTTSQSIRGGQDADIRGVHTSIMPRDPGVSRAGAHIGGHGYGSNQETAKRMHKEKLHEMRSMKKPNLMANGGMIEDNYQSHSNPHKKDGMPIEEDEMHSGFVAHEGDVKRPDHMAMHEDDRMLNQHGEMEQGPEDMMMAEGGQIMDNEQDDAHMMDMVDRIMKQRQMHYSEGGKVANESGIGRLSQMADGERNSFDDLVLRDNLESSYTGANSGDELGDAREDHDRADIVARIMASRKKKDRMPRPA